MVYGLHLFSAFLTSGHSKCFTVLRSAIHAHIHTDGGVNRPPPTHTHTHTHTHTRDAWLAVATADRATDVTKKIIFIKFGRVAVQPKMRKSIHIVK